jgi:long-chain fatty acid transport protein
MRRQRNTLATALTLGCACLSGAALATDGYFQEGYGMKNKGMGGAATARAVDAFGGANNPASMAFLGNRLDVGLGAMVFSPIRESSRFGSGPAGLDGTAESDRNFFLVPEFGVNWMLSPTLALGVTVYGNGGMNTDYPGGQIPAASACFFFNPGPPSYNLLCGEGRLGVDLAQVIIAPTLAYKFHPNHSIGVAPLFAGQRFAAKGLQAFAPFSTDPAHFTNRGHDTSIGAGVRVGYFGRLTPSFSVGAAYSTKIYMDEFDKYKGLFAEQGDFDIPENYNVGIAWQATPKLTIAFDYQRINYSDVKSVGNPSSLLLGCAGGNLSNCLGGSNGAGFGWQDVNVFKLGFEYQYNPRWTFRAGYNRSDNPIRAEDVTINILAPGVIRDHVTLGATYTTPTGGEWTFFYMHAFNHGVTGQSMFTSFGAPPTTTETIKMHQNSVGIAYSWKM